MKDDLNSLISVRIILSLTAILVIAIGSIVLFGWWTHNETLIRIDHAFPPTQPNTAAFFILCGLSLLFFLYSKMKLAFSAAFVVLVVSGMTISEYLFNIDLVIDKLLTFQELAPELPEKPAPNTSVCFFLVGICLILNSLPYRRSFSFLIEILCSASGSIAAISFFGYTLKLYSIIGWYNYAGMALLASIGIPILCVGIFLSHVIYDFYKGKYFYGAIIGSIFLTQYVTFFLWQGVTAERYNNIQKSPSTGIDFTTNAVGHDSFFNDFIPNLILIAGFSSTILIAFILYLLHVLFHTKEQILTILKEKEDALAYRQAILDSSSFSIIATDPKGAIHSFNKAAERMLLWKADELIGKSSPEIFHDKEEVFIRAQELSIQLNENISPGFDAFVTLPKRGLIEDRDWTYVRKDGSRLPVRLSISAVKNAEGDLLGFVGIAYDLIQIKELERMKNELIAITSHELRSPLTSIKGALDLIINANTLTEKDKSLIMIAQKNSSRLLSLTNDILDLQKMESGKMEFIFTDFPLKDLLEKSKEINQIYALNNQVILKMAEDIPECIIHGDEDRLIQVMTNFISNAIKNSPKNSEITFVASKHDDLVRIGVKDQGKGIPEEFHSALFQKFSQLPSNTHKVGTGLGLSICKAIIERHNGKVGFDTSPKGSTFWFELKE